MTSEPKHKKHCKA